MTQAVFSSKGNPTFLSINIIFFRQWVVENLFKLIICSNSTYFTDYQRALTGIVLQSETTSTSEFWLGRYINVFLQFTAMYKITRFVISYLTKDKNVMKKKTQFLLVSLQLSSRYFFTIITALLETFVLCSRVTLCP